MVTAPSTPAPTFDPYAVYAQGEMVLIDQLRALDPHRLRDIAISYDLVDLRTMDSLTTRAQLAAAIAAAVISRASHLPVRVREAGQQRLYGLDALGLRPVHDWVAGFEQLWGERFDRLNEYVKEQQKERRDGG